MKNEYIMKKNRKINLKNITFCIPIRVESQYRMQNLNSLLQYLNIYLDTNYLILEADQISRFKNDLDIKNIDYIFVKDEDEIFHRTKYINQMLKMAKTSYAAVWDTDAIAPIEQVEMAYLALQQNRNTMLYPFSGAFMALNELVSAHFSRVLDINLIEFSYIPKYLMNGFYSVGGAYMVNVQKYLEAGGENENFYGWGPEDAERNARIQILELGVERIDGPLYHLFHTRGINSRDANEENAIKNKKEFCKICGMTTSELRGYIKTWSWNK